MKKIFNNVVLGGLLGLAVGDAFGVPVEFLSREEVKAIDLQDMVGKDTGLAFVSRWGDLIPSGAWSDDTSMTIAAMASVIEQNGKFDYEDIMKRFRFWWYKGYYSCLEFPFGLGGNIGKALERYIQGCPALECGGKGLRDNGNGAMMRMFPFAVYCIIHDFGDDETADFISKAAAITHGHDINKMSCFIYTQFLRECLRMGNPQMAYASICREGKDSYKEYYGRYFSRDAIEAHEDFLDSYQAGGLSPEQIGESGYVVDSLKTAVYSIVNTKDYETAVKMAIDLGYDTDTNGAITGSIAGALYGYDNIPKRWLGALRKREELENLANQFTNCIY